MIHPIPSNRDCRIEEENMMATLARFESVLKGPCPHPHMVKVGSRTGDAMSMYAILDSNCHSGWPECDKGDGDCLWLIPNGHKKTNRVVRMFYALKSEEPRLLQFLEDPDDVNSTTDALEPQVPLFVQPYYSKRPCYDLDQVRIVRHPACVLRRVPIEIAAWTAETRSGALPERASVFMSVAIPPKARGRQSMSSTSGGAHAMMSMEPPNSNLNNADNTEGDWCMKTEAQFAARYSQLDTILANYYEKLGEFEKAYSILPMGDQRIALKQQMLQDILPSIRKYEAEQAFILSQIAVPDAVSEEDARDFVDRLMDELSPLESPDKENLPASILQQLREIKDLLSAPGRAATGKLQVALPVIPLLACYKMELDAESTLMQIWKGIKSLFRRSIGMKKGR